MKKGLIIFLFLIAIAIPILASAQSSICPTPTDSTRLCDPTQQFTGGELNKFLEFILVTFGRLIGWTVIVMVMFSGLRMLLTQGNEEAITKAKASLQWSLIGFVVVLFAYLIVYATNTFLGGKTTYSDGAVSPDQLNPLTSPDFGALLQRMIQQFLVLAATLAILMIMVSGFRYITARGNEEQVNQSKQALLWSLIGLIVIILAYVITVATAKLFGAQVTV